MRRQFSCAVVYAMSIWTGGMVGACQSDDDDEQAQLQALLQDAELQQVPPSAAAPPEETAPGISRSGAAPADLAALGPPPVIWRFDDCSPTQTELRDSSVFVGKLAYRSVSTTCVDGVQGKAVALAATEDIVYAPDQPSYTFQNGVTVAGWFKPTATSGTRTLLRKRDKGTSSFALVLDGGKIQFVASFGHGHAASVTSPGKAKLGVFQHVAATYDGAKLRLYIDGIEVSSRAITGTIAAGAGPVLIGNDGSERRFNGTIDNIAFLTRPLAADEVLQLTCLSERPTIAVTPEEVPPTQAGVSVPFDVAITNHNPPGACAPLTFQLRTFDANTLVDPAPNVPVPSAPVASGETVHLTVTATVPGSATPGSTMEVVFQVADPTLPFSEFMVTSFVVAPTPGCQVNVRNELMITSPAVVDDPLRASFDSTSTDPRNGAWTLKRLFENMAPTPEDAPAMVEAVLASFNTPQVINTFTVDVRPGMQERILATWPRTPDGKLDLSLAPLRLQAIVNRFDLRNLAKGDAGEGRFVFAFYDTRDVALEATLILEYKLPAATEQDVLRWAQSFHALGALRPGERYNAALQAITDRFTGRGVRPGRPNGSAINVVRTNEVAFSDNDIWQFRQFELSPLTGLLAPVTVSLTPDGAFNNSATLASYINANQDAIIAETHTVPLVFEGQPFAAGAIFNDLTTWFAPGVDSNARHHFALNTCNGCHSVDETGTGFLQISPREPHGESALSSFLSGGTVADPVTKLGRSFDDLGRRKLDLEAIVCPGAQAFSGTTLRKGISRVH